MARLAEACRKDYFFVKTGEKFISIDGLLQLV